MERQAHQGKHEALVPVELWERVQGVLDGRFAKKAKRGRARLRLFGVDRLPACGCAVVGEIKKQRYVYYHCTGYADKCQGNPASCRRKYVREEALEAQFTELLGRLRFDDEVLEWVRDALHASHADERREHEEAIRRHQAEYKRLDDRIHAMYVDKLDGLVDTAFFERMSNQWREEQNRCQREIERHAERRSDPTWTKASRFSNSPGTPKGCSRSRNRAKNAACSISCYRTALGRMAKWSPLSAQPLICLAETAVIAARVAAAMRPQSAKTEIWLGD